MALDTQTLSKAALEARGLAMDAVQAASSAKYVGLDGKTIGIDRFGLSAPCGTVMKEPGITPEHVVEAAKSLL